MPRLKLFGAVAVLAGIATPAAAQAVMTEPAYCAFFYPDANCQDKGPGNPYTDPNYHGGQSARAWAAGETVGAAPMRSRARRAHAPATRMQ